MERRQENENYSYPSLRLNDIKDRKNKSKNKVEILKHTMLEIEELNNIKQPKIKELRKTIKNLPTENRFDFTKFVGRQREEYEIDLGLFSETALEGKIVYNQQ